MSNVPWKDLKYSQFSNNSCAAFVRIIRHGPENSLIRPPMSRTQLQQSAP